MHAMPPTDQRPRRRRLSTVAIAPAAMTLGNALSGFMAIFWASRETDLVVLGHFSPLTIAAALVFLGMVFDALDGSVARLTRQISSFGAQLDSMADMVTFGVAPAFIVIQLNHIGAPYFAANDMDTWFDRIVLLIAAVYVACCALRLARFNIEHAQTTAAEHAQFNGLPSPGAAGTLASMVLCYLTMLDVDFDIGARVAAFTIIATMLAVSLLMISGLPYSHAINRYIRGKGTFLYFGLAVVAVILMLTVPQWSLAGVFIAYALGNPVVYFFRWWYGKITEDEEDVEMIDDTTQILPLEPDEQRRA